MRILPGLNPAFRDASGLPTPEALQTICWVAPRLAAEFEPLIPLCELENVLFQRHRPILAREESLTNNAELSSLNLFNLSELLHQVTLIAASEETGNADILRYVIRYGHQAFDERYRKVVQVEGQYGPGEAQEAVSDVLGCRLSTLYRRPTRKTLRIAESVCHVGSYWAEPLLEEAHVYCEKKTDPQKIASVLGAMFQLWGESFLPWLFYALELAATTLLTGACEVTERARRAESRAEPESQSPNSWIDRLRRMQHQREWVLHPGSNSKDERQTDETTS